MDVALIAGLVDAVVSLITLVALIGGGFYWSGRVSAHVDSLDKRMYTLDSRVDSLDKRMYTLDSRVDSLSGNVNALRVELLDEMRRNQQLLLTALSGHAHSDTNEVWFGQPLGVGSRIVHHTPPPGAEAPAVPPGAEVPAT